MELFVLVIAALVILALLVFLLKNWRLLVKLALFGLLLFLGGAFLCQQNELPFCPSSSSPPSLPVPPSGQPRPGQPSPPKAPHGGSQRPQLPDLAILKAHQLEFPAAFGSPVAFQISVINAGASYQAPIRVEGTGGIGELHGGLKTGDIKSVTIVAPPSVISATFMIDPEGLIQESNESNNSVTVQVRY